jgi:hypothetical protein
MPRGILDANMATLFNTTHNRTTIDHLTKIPHQNSAYDDIFQVAITPRALFLKVCCYFI